MNTPTQPNSERKKQRVIPTASAVLPDGTLVELVRDPETAATRLLRGNSAGWTLESSVETKSGDRLVPYSAANNLLVHDVVLLASQPEQYGSDADLLARIRAFIHGYVDLSPVFEELAAYYVLLTWLYDCFHELPYLRVRGDYGSGKSRFLLIVGSICYKPMFASGASTTSPLFRIMDAFRGTLILDESDFRFSDERTDIIKILNNGNARGFPILRTEINRSKEFDPRAYTVFGPKLVATRGYFEDRALESRCLTEDMGQVTLRADVPLNLDDAYKEEARSLRDQLLLFRLRRWSERRAVPALDDKRIEPRLRQIFAPFLSLIEDDGARERAVVLLRGYQKDLVSERALAIEARVLEVLDDLVTPETETLHVSDVATLLANRAGDELERPVTAKWIGGVLRKRLGLKPFKRHGVFVVAGGDLKKIPRLVERYGLKDSPADEPKESSGTTSPTAGASP